MPRYPFARFLTYALFAFAIVSLLGAFAGLWAAALGSAANVASETIIGLETAAAGVVGSIVFLAIRAGLQILMDLEADTRAGRATPEPERQTPELTAAAWD